MRFRPVRSRPGLGTPIDDTIDFLRGWLAAMDGSRAIQLWRDDPKVSLFSDVYSFGSVALEVRRFIFSFSLVRQSNLKVFTGERPYHYVQSDMEVLLKYIVNLVKPNRPKGVQDEHWEVVEKCWEASPQSRPSSKSLTGFFACVE